MQPQIKNTLRRLNLDDNFHYLDKDDYVDALNITQDTPTEGGDISTSNEIGNRLVYYQLPAGRNKTIGAKQDILRNRVYEFIWNSNDFHSIVLYNNITRTRTKLIENLTDTGNVDILQFDENKKINHVDIIPKSEDEGDLVFWTDGNVTPKKINEKHISDGIYGTLLKSFIEVAKAPPLSPITAVYGNDATRLANSVNKKMFMFTYRYQYDDFEKTSFSTYSKIPLPIGYYGSDNDTDPSKNNFITLTFETGAKNVIAIEIGMRVNIGGEWDDFVQIANLIKADLLIPDNSTSSYLFYNDNIYPPFDIQEVTSLHDWVPRTAASQCLLNGNVLDYACIREDYNNIPVNELDVTITVENKTNNPPDTDPPSVTYVQSGSTFTFTVNGSVPTGTEYKIYIFFNGNPGIGQTYGVRLVADYTSLPGDTVDDVAFELYSDFNSYPSVPIIGGSYFTNYWNSTFGTSGNSVQQIIVTPGSSGGGTISSEKVWLPYCNYILGLVYFDEQNRNMPGVQTKTNPTDSDNDFAFSTPAFSVDTGLPQTAVVSAAINHLPPEGAVKYCWVRQQITYAKNPLFYETCDFQEDTDYYYFCLANIEQYKTDNSQFIYGTAPITAQSRIKVMDSITANLFDGNAWTQDYEILGTVTRTLTGGSSPADDRLFIKVKIPLVAPSPAYTANLYVMVYAPAANPTSVTDSVFNEFGETYDIYELDGVNYHRGMDQDQTGSQPATFTFIEGDVYFHQRNMYPGLVATPPLSFDTVTVFDANYSDFFVSSVNDNGRAQVININAKNKLFKTLNRFSRDYQLSTNINQTNRFYYNNFTEYSLEFGEILRLHVKDQYMKVGQQLKIGRVPVGLQIIKSSGGASSLIVSDTLLNTIEYYTGEVGVGESPESWASFNFADYFMDTVRGALVRNSINGNEVISRLYKINAWAIKNIVLRTGNYKGYGCYNQATNEYIIALEATDTSPAKTLKFSENDNAFKSFISAHPEMMCTLGTLLIMFKDGQLWTHDNPVYNNFFGVQYPSSITPVFSEGGAIKKTFNAIGYQSNKVWASPEKGDIATSEINEQTGLQQESAIRKFDYDLEEGVNVAAFNFDMNSMNYEQMALVEGDYLKGTWVKTKLVLAAEDAVGLVSIDFPYITASLSSRTF